MINCISVRYCGDNCTMGNNGDFVLKCDLFFLRIFVHLISISIIMYQLFIVNASSSSYFLSFSSHRLPSSGLLFKMSEEFSTREKPAHKPPITGYTEAVIACLSITDLRYTVGLTLLACIGGLLFGYDTGIMSGYGTSLSSSLYPATINIRIPISLVPVSSSSSVNLLGCVRWRLSGWRLSYRSHQDWLPLEHSSLVRVKGVEGRERKSMTSLISYPVYTYGSIWIDISEMLIVQQDCSYRGMAWITVGTLLLSPGKASDKLGRRLIIIFASAAFLVRGDQRSEINHEPIHWKIKDQRSISGGIDHLCCSTQQGSDSRRKGCAGSGHWWERSKIKLQDTEIKDQSQVSHRWSSRCTSLKRRHCTSEAPLLRAIR